MDYTELIIQNILTMQKLSPISAFRGFAHNAACEISRNLDLRGPIETVSSGCNSGADAIGLALDWIRLGRADVVLAGGTEAELCKTFYHAMNSARALSVRHNDTPEKSSRPFDIERDGNVAGEGAGFLILEKFEHAAKRNAEILGYISGFSNCSSGKRPSYNPFQPKFEIEPMLWAMKSALVDANIQVEELSAISANGSSSSFYDPLEATAIRALLGKNANHIPVYSIKGALGQTGAVTPALQSISAIMSLKDKILPPTCNLENPDPLCEGLLFVKNSPHDIDCGNHILINSIGFGGFYYSCLVFTGCEQKVI